MKRSVWVEMREWGMGEANNFGNFRCPLKIISCWCRLQDGLIGSICLESIERNVCFIGIRCR